MRRIAYSPEEIVGQLIFVAPAEPRVSSSGNKTRMAIFRCRCGKEFKTAISGAKSGNTKSCGCEKLKALVNRSTKHGQSPMLKGSRVYRFWQSMKDRCNNPQSSSYCDYGQRGISCYWENDFSAFFEYFKATFSVDEIPDKMSMDRIDTNGNYCPGNLRIADMLTQANNKRNNVIIEWRGQSTTIPNLARKFGIRTETLRSRICIQNKTPEEAVAMGIPK